MISSSNLLLFSQGFKKQPGLLVKVNPHCDFPGVNSKSARVLLMLVIPGHLVFLYAISLLQGEEAPISVAFTICYLCAAVLQVN